jgi:hypothetical protein
MGTNRENPNWWSTLPGLLTGAGAFVTALTGLLVWLNQAGIWPVKTVSIATAAPQISHDSNIPSSATLLCSAQADSWGRKPCGSTTIIFQPIYSGNDSAIITTNAGSKRIWVTITPICKVAPQCGEHWTHVVDPSQNENLTVNEPGLHEFNWTAHG